MNSKPIFLLVASTLLLYGCNAPAESTPLSSEEESIAPNNSNEASSVSGEEKEEPSKSVEPAVLEASYRILDGEGKEETEIKEGAGLTHKLVIDVTNLPEGKGIEDCVFSFPDKIERLAELKPDASLGKNERYLLLENAGVYIGEVTVTCGNQNAAVALEIEIKKDHSLYTQIGTADGFKAQVLKASEGRFELTADIDLNGAIIKGWESGVVFGGVLDGNGHSITNFSVPPISGKETGNGIEGGLWMHVGSSAIIRDLHLHGEINQPGGWGSLLGKEVQAGAIIENCLMEADATFVPADSGTFDWTWCRSGIAAGFLQGVIRNCVFIKNSESDQTMDVAPYAAPEARIENVYTSSAANLSFPFDPDPGQSWCGKAVEINNHPATNWGKMKAKDVELSKVYWDIEDGKVPSLRAQSL